MIWELVEDPKEKGWYIKLSSKITKYTLGTKQNLEGSLQFVPQNEKQKVVSKTLFQTSIFLVLFLLSSTFGFLTLSS